uniref:hypothetical protein n=1 Tax=Prevotella sp. TaxID=59823 RepID=UPI0040267D06
MKRFILLLVLSIIYATSIFAQQKFFCEIKGAEKELSSGLKIVFDFGKHSVYGSLSSLKSKQKIVDDKGEVIPFNSMVDAGNYLSGKGWTFVQAYTSVYGGQAINHWIFFKESDSIEKACEGIVTKEMYGKTHK